MMDEQRSKSIETQRLTLESVLVKELNGSLVRKKVNALLERMERDGNNMPTMPWKRLYQSKGIYRESDGNHTPVSAM